MACAVAVAALANVFIFFVSPAEDLAIWRHQPICCSLQAGSSG
jgi:hypothetical protein